MASPRRPELPRLPSLMALGRTRRWIPIGARQRWQRSPPPDLGGNGFAAPFPGWGA